MAVGVRHLTSQDRGVAVEERRKVAVVHSDGVAFRVIELGELDARADVIETWRILELLDGS